MWKRLLAVVMTVLMMASLCACSGVGNSDTEDTKKSPSYVDGTVTTIVTGSITGKTEDVPQEVQELLHGFMVKWYESLGSLVDGVFTDYFLEDEDAINHSAINKTMVELRKAALEDLSMVDCTFSLNCQKVTTDSDAGTIEIYALESGLFHFAATPDVDSKLFDMEHTFTCKQMENGSWLLLEHWEEDSPFIYFELDEETGVDASLPVYLNTISSRQSQLDEHTPSEKTAQHGYARNEAYKYMETYSDHRNESYLTMDESGGNCTNFISQVLLAGGIPMDRAGDAIWYETDWSDYTSSFISVSDFTDYAGANTGYGLVADTGAAYYTGDVGDVLMLGRVKGQHATVISNMILDENGNTVDYLICSNTANYQDYPAGAYFFTNHQLIKIIGWNNA